MNRRASLLPSLPRSDKRSLSESCSNRIRIAALCYPSRLRVSARRKRTQTAAGPACPGLRDRKWVSGCAWSPLGCWRADRPAYGWHASGAAALAPSLRPEDTRASGAGFKFERLPDSELSFGPARRPSHRDGHAAVTVAGVTAAPFQIRVTPPSRGPWLESPGLRLSNLKLEFGTTRNNGQTPRDPASGSVTTSESHRPRVPVPGPGGVVTWKPTGDGDGDRDAEPYGDPRPSARV